jgi:hypothetical protein
MNEQQKRPLTDTELEKLSSIFYRLSTAARYSFLASMIVKYPENYPQIIERLGEMYEKTIVRA